MLFYCAGWRSASGFVMRIRSAGCACLVGFLGAAASAQERAILTLVPETTARINPGSIISVEVFVDNVPDNPTPPPTNLLSVYQVTVEVVPLPGAIGLLSLAAIPDPMFINKARGDYVFFGHSVIDVVDVGEMRLGAVLLEASGIEVLTPKYCGTYVFQASDDADGEFEANFVHPGGDDDEDFTFLVESAEFNAFIPVDVFGTTVRVGLQPTTVTVDVELSATMAPGPLVRCTTFELWDCDAVGGPMQASVEQDISFTGGLATAVTVAIPGGGWDCITARDTLHTLRSTAPDFATVDGLQYTASFTGDRGSGGHWLLGGNLNDDEFIDILDFAVFMTQFSPPADADTPCGTIGPDANINGDNVIDLIDFVFVQVNSFQASEPNCCGMGGAASSGPINAISIGELRRLGLYHLRFADLNRDGMLDAEDVAAFLEGSRPSPDYSPAKAWRRSRPLRDQLDSDRGR